MPDKVTGYIEYVRLIVNAIKRGRVQAATVDAMTDEEVGQLIEQLQAADQAEIDRGHALDNDQP